eukprot:GFKZ01012057.1.p1 GENE.GFKZ01012057.1~~GFKZ01012057.1.p1  ORF type:complete len:138 (-),score=13.72 GFKZ01012057.1:79-492(-)
MSKTEISGRRMPAAQIAIPVSIVLVGPASPGMTATLVATFFIFRRSAAFAMVCASRASWNKWPTWKGEETVKSFSDATSLLVCSPWPVKIMGHREKGRGAGKNSAVRFHQHMQRLANVALQKMPQDARLDIYFGLDC